VRRAEAGAVVAVEVLVEEDVVAPLRVLLEPLDAPEARPATVRTDEEEGDEAVAEIGRDLVERQAPARPVDYSSV
jgi:nucleoside diphosphate kinase